MWYFHTIFKTETAAKIDIECLMLLISFKVKFRPFLIVFFLFRIVDKSSFQILKVWTWWSLMCGESVSRRIKFLLCYGYQPSGNLTKESVMRNLELTLVRCWSSKPTVEVLVSYKYPQNSGKGLVLYPAMLWETRAALAQKAWGAHCGKYRGSRNTESHKAPHPQHIHIFLLFNMFC